MCEVCVTAHSLTDQNLNSVSERLKEKIRPVMCSGGSCSSLCCCSPVCCDRITLWIMGKVVEKHRLSVMKEVECFSIERYQGGRPCLSREAKIDDTDPFKLRQAQGLEAFMRKDFIYGSRSIDRVTLMKTANLRALPAFHTVLSVVSPHLPFIMHCLHMILDAISQGCSAVNMKSNWSLVYFIIVFLLMHQCRLNNARLYIRSQLIPNGSNSPCLHISFNFFY